jgi:hypothetical protein
MHGELEKKNHFHYLANIILEKENAFDMAIM